MNNNFFCSVQITSATESTSVTSNTRSTLSVSSCVMRSVSATGRLARLEQSGRHTAMKMSANQPTPIDARDTLALKVMSDEL